MKRVLMTTTAIVAASLLMVGCGSDSNTKYNTVEPESKTDIATQEDARKAASLIAAMQFNKIAGSMTQSLAAPQRSSTRITYPAPYEKERECAASGIVTTVGEKSNLFTYHATNSFLNCQHLDGLAINGSQIVDATLENNRLTASLSDNAIIVSLNGLTMTIASEMKLYANQDLSIIETILLKDTIMYQYYADEEHEGYLNIFGATYSDFNVTLNAPLEKMYLNGQVQIDECGSYDIKTLSPITIGANGNYSSGELNINGAQYVYHDNNTVTVTVDENTVYTVSQNITENLCGLEQGELIEDERFIRDDRLAVVIDNERELMWQDNRAVKTVYKPWLTSANFKAGNLFDTSGDTAATYCSELVLAGEDDWRLPNDEELMSISDSSNRPAIKAVFQNVSSANWSSEFSGHPEFAQYADFGLFGNMSGFRKTFFLNVRCVREWLH